MRLFARMVQVGLVGGMMLAGVGCGGSDGSGGSHASGPTEEATLNDLAALLKSVADQKKKPPAKLADLDQYEPIFMAAYKGVAASKVVYIWGSGYAAGGTQVVAHEATAEASGGFVLLQDGTVKRMTAVEFAAAPKAAKPTAGKK